MEVGRTVSTCLALKLNYCFCFAGDPFTDVYMYVLTGVLEDGEMPGVYDITWAPGILTFKLLF